MPTAVGWDGCASCFGCSLCNEAEGDCCVDCTYESEFSQTRVHDCPKCYCDGGTFGTKFSNQVCNCEHTCPPEEKSDAK